MQLALWLKGPQWQSWRNRMTYTAKVVHGRRNNYLSSCKVQERRSQSFYTWSPNRGMDFGIFSTSTWLLRTHNRYHQGWKFVVRWSNYVEFQDCITINSCRNPFLVAICMICALVDCRVLHFFTSATSISFLLFSYDTLITLLLPVWSLQNFGMLILLFW